MAKRDQQPGKEVLHGNLAKVDPKKKVEPLFTTNTVTISEKKDRDGTPLRDDSNTEFARRVQEELKL